MAVKAKQKSRVEVELMMLLSLEDIIPRLLTPTYGGYTRRYQFLKESLKQVKRQRLFLEEAMLGNPVAIKNRRAPNGANKPVAE